jgi:hypothetical protein
MLNRLQDVFKSFQQHEVRYVVIGGIQILGTFSLHELDAHSILYT